MSFPHRLAEKSSFENGLPDHYVQPTSIMEQPGEMIMSSIVSAAVAASSRSPLESMTDFWAGLSARFYRFLEELPERSEDVDPEVFKRVPVPVWQVDPQAQNAVGSSDLVAQLLALPERLRSAKRVFSLIAFGRRDGVVFYYWSAEGGERAKALRPDGSGLWGTEFNISAPVEETVVGLISPLFLISRVAMSVFVFASAITMLFVLGVLEWLKKCTSWKLRM
jgi:hypothetical protein